MTVVRNTGQAMPGVLELASTHRAGTRDIRQTVEMLIATLGASSEPAAWIVQVQPNALRRRAGELAAGRQDLPLLGVPFAVKDNIDVVGLPTTAGCPSYAYEPATSAHVVERLLAAGAILVGKTNLDQFATGLVGTRSPHGACPSVASAAHISGGSSSGSAVAVARGLVAFSLGTDTAGSGRVPAAFNGLIGLKPTLGSLSTGGIVPACRTLDCVSILARHATDAAAVLAVAEGFDPADPFSRQRPHELTDTPSVLGVPREADLASLEDGPVRMAWVAAVARAAEIAKIVEVDVSAFLQTAPLLYAGPWVAERYAAFGAFLERGSNDLDPTVRDIVLGGALPSAADAFRGIYRLAELRRQTEDVWTQVDALLIPTAPRHPTLAEVASDPVGVNAQLGTWTNFVNLLDLAALAIPADPRVDDLPFGVTLVASAWSDNALLRFAMRWERRNGGAVAGDAATVAMSSAAIDLAVVGAHLSGMARNHELLALGGHRVATTQTSCAYRLFDLGDGTGRPGMVRDEDSGSSIALEVWRLKAAAFGRLVATIESPLAIGTVELNDGTSVKGFLCEGHAVEGTDEVTQFGGWRAYLSAAPAQTR